MVLKYQKIAIIYGGEGVALAEALKDRIEKEHTDEMLPVKAEIFCKDILNSALIMEEVINMMRSASICVVVMGFDEVQEGNVRRKRVRPNVLIETGIAWTLLGKERLIVLCDDKMLPEDFPSNIRCINPNKYNEDNIRDKADQVLKEIISELQDKETTALIGENNKNLLIDQHYSYNGRVLEEVPSEVFEKNGAEQMRGILETWGKTIESFDYFSERVVYILERIVFLPIFPNDEYKEQFYKIVSNSIKTTNYDIKQSKMVCGDDKEKSTYGNLCEFCIRTLHEIVNYTRTVSKINIESLYDQNKSRSAEKLLTEFKLIAEKLEGIFNTPDAQYLNWLIRISAINYAGLARLKLYQIGQICTNQQNDEILVKHLQKACDNFGNALKIAEKKDLFSNYIWAGFIEYNRSRVFRYLFEKTKEEQFLAMFDDTLSSALFYRNKWVDMDELAVDQTANPNGYKGVFAAAMTYEYFLAAGLDYELRYTIKEFKDDSPEMIVNEVDKLIDKLNIYCKETEMERLFQQRDNLKKLEERIRIEQKI